MSEKIKKIISSLISLSVVIVAAVMIWPRIFRDDKCDEHEFSIWMTIKEATCESDGLERRSCINIYCDEEETKVIPATGEHSFGEWEITLKPSCIEGQQERVCSVCDYKEEAKLSANGQHSFGAWKTVIDSTCGDYGTAEKLCKLCGHVETKAIAPEGMHHYGKWYTLVEPTCGEQGTSRRDCEDCSNNYETKPISSTSEHVFAEFGADCSVCGADYCTVGLEYTLADDEQSYILTGDGEVRDEEIVVPAYYRDLPVTEIGNAAFDHAGYLKRIHLPDSVTKIDSAAFRECYNLGGVRMSENSLLYSLGSSAFEGCDRLYFEIPETVKLIGQYCFRDTTLIQTVGNVSYVGNWAVEFKNTTDVTSVTVRDGTVGIGSGMKGQYLKTINLPDSVKYISGGAFSQCVNLKNITIPDGVEEIFGGTFSGCYALTEIVIPASIKRIGSRAFENCPLTSVTFENSDGWRYNYDGYWRVIEEDLSDTSVAATALKRTYVNRELKIDE